MPASPLLLEACVTLLVNAFAKPERYSAQRLYEELRGDSSVFYRQFFVAVSQWRHHRCWWHQGS
jgi:hypothetical protein